MLFHQRRYRFTFSECSFCACLAKKIVINMIVKPNNNIMNMSSTGDVQTKKLTSWLQSESQHQQ